MRQWTNSCNRCIIPIGIYSKQRQTITTTKYIGCQRILGRTASLDHNDTITQSAQVF